MLKVILVILVAFLAVVNCQWEGTWDAGNRTVYVCLEGTSSLHIRTDRAFLYGTVSSTDSTVATGKYFLLGDKFTGLRATYGNFYAGRGKHQITYDETTDTLSGILYQKGPFGSTTTFTWTRLGTDAGTGTERIANCGIIDTTSTATANGYWLSNDSSAITMHLCITGTKFEASYSFNYNYDKSDAILPGYFIGYCAMKGQVCGGVYYQNDTDYETYSIFGAETAVRLSDDRLVLVHTRGAPGVIGWSGKKGINYLDRQSASTTECAAYIAEYFNPLKCRSFDLDFCAAVAGFGFCEVSNTQGACVRSAFTTD